MPIRLGLDLGPNSIGWALVDSSKAAVIASGVRTFPEGLDNFDTGKESSRNEQRRSARMMRRQTIRRQRRRVRLRQSLIEAGLFPADPQQQEALYQADPYELRSRAVTERLEPFEIGRVLLHLNQRRGFWSSRKEKAKADEAGKKRRSKKPAKKKAKSADDTTGMLEEIGELEKAIAQAGCATLGQYLHLKAKALNHKERVENDHVRNRHTNRAMLLHEFDIIWAAQAKHYPGVLSAELGYGKLGRQKYPRKPMPRHHDERGGMSDLEAFGLHGLIFFQRPIYWPKSMIGLCELEPKKLRCPKSHRLCEQFRLLQEINNIRYIAASGDDTALTDEERRKLLGHLATREKMTFDQMRKKLGFYEGVRFNLEAGKRKFIKGRTTDWLIAKKLGKEWHDRSEDEKTRIVGELLQPGADEDELADRLVDTYHLLREDAEKLVTVDLPAGYANLSLTAICKLLPHLEKGLRYMADDEANSALHAAGYLRRDQLKRRIFDTLPLPERVPDCPIGDIPNPVVKRALHQLRKVVNNIIREYGKPDAVHVEMARSVKMGPERRRDYNMMTREREVARNEAADNIRASGGKVTRDAILRILLWHEQNHECIYCEGPISQTQLLTGGVDVDHILPLSLSHDNSQSNKVVCHRRCNADKGQRTPYEWLADADPGRFDAICQRGHSLLRGGTLSYGKYRKLQRRHVDSKEFLERQLVDTGYIARATAEYLRCLFGEGHAVLGLKGQYTATLRHHWGLTTVLEELPDSPAWDEKSKLRPGEKNRADHRHHAIDAIVLALTDRAVIRTLSRVSKTEHGGDWLDQLPKPWDGFREHVIETVRDIKISRQVERGVRGALHEDTLYGPVHDRSGRRIEGEFVVRKPLAGLTLNEIAHIRDPQIREIVGQRLAELGIKAGRGVKLTADQKKTIRETLSNMQMPSGVPIRKVRLIKKEKTIRPIRVGKPGEAWVKPGNTHHLCLFEWTDGGKIKRDAVFVTMLEAIDRLKREEPIIQRTPPAGHPTIPPNATFLMSLSGGEMVLADVKGEEKLLVFKTAASTQGQMYFVLHTDARRSGVQEKHVFMANTLHARKVTVDLLGRVRWAND
jgi:CRISPR-associated endonuclease Csn1